MRQLLQFTAMVLVFAQQSSEAVECVIPNQIRTRIFDSITEYQANKYPFDSLSPDWLGSVVSFNVSTIGTLHKNIFITKDSEHVLKMILSGKQIGKIEDGAFLQLDCLHELLLDHNNISKLSKKTFLGLPHLENLSLSNNLLTNLPDLVFSSVPRLKMLDLRYNQIKSVDSLTFNNLTMLEVLNLESNNLSTIPVDVFLPLNNLKSLNLAWNKLTDVEPEKWKGLQKLESMNLAGNGLNHFDFGYNFSFSSLKTLNLSSNFLTVLNVVPIRKNLPNLGLIVIDNNRWYCPDLESLVHDLNLASIKFFSSDNNSTNSVQGIACSDTSVLPTGTTEKGITTTGTTIKYQTSTLNESYIKRIVEKKFKESSESIVDSIRYLQTLVIFLFVLLGVFILFEIVVRTNYCRVVLKLFRGDSTYFDNNDAENFRLLNR